MYAVIPPTILFLDVNGNRTLPDNRVNDLFEDLVNDEMTRELKNTSTMLAGSQYRMLQSRDFEVLKARKLRYDEYTMNEDLGIISLNIRLRPNQVLAVSYQYHYTFNGDEVYQVGELTENVAGTDNVIYCKLLKSTTQSVTSPTWDLMMKNVYPLGAAQVSSEDFKLDIFFEDNRDGSLKRFLPDPDFSNLPLLNVFNLDRLNSVGDPQQDGVFDFVPGVTIIPRNGSVIFPVLEPFGSSLVDLLNDPAKAEIYAFPELYDSTITHARELLHKNKFVIMGEYKAGITSEISLGSWNIPPGSETVRVGSQILTKGVDYEIEYGIGRVKILNDAFLQQGVPIRITFEDNSIFSLQQKTMLGLRADYEVNKNLNIGATYLHLFERPFTEKVNIGDDPINNRIMGLDVNFSNETPFITRIVDKLPFYSTKEASSIDFSAEAAILKPGHSKAINLSDDDGGVVSIDDFEGAASEVPLGTQPNQWVLASTPQRFPESQLANDLSYGMNRARLNWYVIDRSSRSNEDRSDSYTRTVTQQELFPNKSLDTQELPDLFTFDLSYYPDERGPYNFDLPGGTAVSSGTECEGETLKLADPASRWGGVMRYINNNDFEATNVEFIEFWMMNPFMDRRDGSGHSADEEGSIYFNLGNVSEDILKDNLQFFENTIPTPNQTINVQIQETPWGNVPQRTPTNPGFSISETEAQDIGLDGLDNVGENERFENFVNQTVAAYPACADVELDPANDDFAFFGDEMVFPGESNLLERYSRFNNPQGNAPSPDDTGIQERGNPIPDKEDLNRNWSLDQGESFFEYELKVKNLGGEIDTLATPYITDEVTTVNPTTQIDEKWYRFRIPLKDGIKVNNIQDFRSIQFIRMYMAGFETQKTFRLAEFQFIRNQWRKLDDCQTGFDGKLDFSIDKVSIEENSGRVPFPYVLPKGIKRERVFSSFSNVLQDERALSIKFNDLPGGCAATIYKLTQFDMRVFDKLQMFVHAESMDDLVPGDLSIFVRLGKDFRNNYYEYEIPLVLSDVNGLGGNTEEVSAEVWREENMINFNLDLFTELKKERNQLGSNPVIYIGSDPDNPEANVKILGNPSLGYVKGIQIGIRNNKGETTKLFGEVWVNELRAVGLDEQGGVAATARLDIQMADLGNMTFATNYSSIGWGALDQKLDQRSKEKVFEYDAATNLELGKFFPSKWGLRIPFYAQFV
jgi:cell surface protein SprA